MQLFLIRHGESLANCARHKAEIEQSLTIDFEGREQDVSLSEKGKLQSKNARKFFNNPSNKPNMIFCSPYARTRETAALLVDSTVLMHTQVVYDERLRERELGMFDGLTKLGAMLKYPEECAKREHYGKFYYRPIGGENWADVALRVRSFWRDLQEDYADKNVLIVTHEVVIRVFKYVLEDLTEAEVLAIDKSGDVENGAITSYNVAHGKVILDLDNFVPNE
jgi:2,3-bisphosphoglycerate-dependent phosphoglycerate mutase